MMRFPKAIQAALDLTLSKADADAPSRPLYNADWVIGDTIFSLVAFTSGASVIVSKLGPNFAHIPNTQRQYHYTRLACGSVAYKATTHHRNPEVVC